MPILKVPYKSQWDSDADDSKNDCGAASIAMGLNYFNKVVTTDEVYQKTGEKIDDGINFSQLAAATKAFGFTLTGSTNKTISDIKNLIDQGIPAIVVLHYGLLPGRQDTFQGGHILVVRGYDDKDIYTNDPDFYSTRRNEGDGKKYPIADFTKAWNSTLDGNAPGNLWYINPPSGWKNDNCETKIANLEDKVAYEAGEKERYKTEARASRDIIKQKDTEILSTNKKYADLTDLYKKMLEGTTNNEEYNQLLQLHDQASKSLETANRTIIEKNGQITDLEDQVQYLRGEEERLKYFKFKPREALLLLFLSFVKK